MIPISHPLLITVGAIEREVGEWRAKAAALPPSQLSSLSRQAVVASVAASLRLGGQPVTDHQTAELLEAPAAASPLAREAAGHARVLTLLISSHGQMPFSEQAIKQLHRVLFRAGSSNRDRGEYRRGEAQIAPAMHALAGETARLLDNGTVHPLLVIGTFVHRFSALRPFAEDNRRLARLLAALLLLQNGFPAPAYAPLDRSFEHYCEPFASLTPTSPEPAAAVPEEWLLLFLDILRHHQAGLTELLAEWHEASRLPLLDREILSLAGAQGPITNRTIRQHTGANRNTVKARLRVLVEAGRLARIGRGKGCRYLVPAA